MWSTFKEWSSIACDFNEWGNHKDTNKKSRSEPKDDPHIADVTKKQILGTETNRDDDLPPPSSTVADIDIDSNNDNNHKKACSI